MPYLTADLPGVGGAIKSAPDDFYVEELPLYEASGSGQHVYLTLEKRGITTLKAIDLVAGALHVSRRAIGYAGLKDARAVTRQTISIDNVSPEKVQQLEVPGLKVLDVRRHENKLKLGHLAGNRFVIKIRRVEREALPRAEAIFERLQAWGVPNYFGQQRFGLRNNSHRLGLALIQQNPTEFMAEFLGRPQPNEHPKAQRARAAFDAGQWDEALANWPPMLSEERAILQRLVNTANEATALRSLDKRLKRLFAFACQSHLFNQLLVDRLPTLNRLEDGDVAYIHRNGACFLVESAAREQPRVDAFEISPAGPMFGTKYLAASGEPGAREMALLAAAGISLTDFKLPGFRLNGGRRPYRIPLAEVDLAWDDNLLVSFTLPPGSYATIVLREVMKNDKF